jgi:predicted TIM-barrel enzyme
MVDEPENLTLRYLRRIDSKIDGLAETQREHGHRLTRIESSLASMRRDQANDAEAIALSSARTDRLSDRIGRIERRLEIADAPEGEPG